MTSQLAYNHLSLFTCHNVREFILTTQWHEIMGIGVLFFAALYFGIGGLTWFLSHWLLPKIVYGHVLEGRSNCAAN